MNDIYDDIISIKKALKLNNEDLGSLLNKSGDTFRKSMSRKSLSDFELKALLKTLSNVNSEKDSDTLSKIQEALNKIRTKIQKNKQLIRDKILLVDEENELLSRIKGDPAYLDLFTDHNDESEIKVNEPSEIYPTKSGNIIEELANGKYLLTVPMVPYKAHATYISEFTDAEYISDLTKVSFIVDRIPRGKYQAFEIQNDSMNDATLERGPSREAILNGDIVLGRELGKQHWTSKLNTNNYPYWIIVHKNTIVCKEIINHDVENGTITCHSLNDSPEFQDFDLKLDDCHQLFNIIKKQV
ncbi:hypothetical protein [Winogradskyella forsetii]|uniref:hypothetical protein n=1 Tax=Winogradskyella forsetii TaxID=2686077 RepID=UPI0015C0CA77|nr:hypothetical protein [Winogradskyella forsetii]